MGSGTLASWVVAGVEALWEAFAVARGLHALSRKEGRLRWWARAVAEAPLGRVEVRGFLGEALGGVRRLAAADA